MNDDADVEDWEEVDREALDRAARRRDRLSAAGGFGMDALFYLVGIALLWLLYGYFFEEHQNSIIERVNAVVDAIRAKYL